MTKKPYQATRIDRFITWIGSVPSIILHTAVFAGFFFIWIVGIIELNTMLLILTTAVSLEAIYLALLIQMTVNRNTASLREVEEDIDEIQEDVEDLGEDLEEIQEDIEEMTEDVGEIQEDLEEVSKDVGEMQEDIEEMSEEEEAEDTEQKAHVRSLEQLTEDIRSILSELEALKKK